MPATTHAHPNATAYHVIAAALAQTREERRNGSPVEVRPDAAHEVYLRIDNGPDAAAVIVHVTAEAHDAAAAWTRRPEIAEALAWGAVANQAERVNVAANEAVYYRHDDRRSMADAVDLAHAIVELVERVRTLTDPEPKPCDGCKAQSRCPGEANHRANPGDECGYCDVPTPEPTGEKAAADLIDAGPIDPREALPFAVEIAERAAAGTLELWFQMDEDEPDAEDPRYTFWTFEEGETVERHAERIADAARDMERDEAESPGVAYSHRIELVTPGTTREPSPFDDDNRYSAEDAAELRGESSPEPAPADDAPNVAEGLNAIADNAAHWTPEQIRAHALALTHHVPAPEPAGLAVPGILPTWTPPEGCTVIAAGTPTAQSRSAAAAIVLVERRTAAGEVYEYATGDVYEHTASGWGAGHYYRDENAAREDYARRMARGY